MTADSVYLDGFSPQLNPEMWDEDAMKNIARHCRITKAIIEKACQIPEGTVMGEDRAEDEKRFYVSEGGVVLVTPEMLGQRRHYVR